MPALTDITRYKRLAELFATAIKLDATFSIARNEIALQCMMDHGLNQRQSERFLETAIEHFDRNLLRSPRQTIHDASIICRRRDHAMVLQQVQTILEAGDVTPEHQQFFDACYEFFYHEQ